VPDFTRLFNVATPAGNGVITTAKTTTRLPLSVVRSIELVFPPGCAGLVGCAVYAGGSPAFPIDYGSYFTYDARSFMQDVSNQIVSGDWSVVTYNQDYLQHTLQVIFQADYWKESASTLSTSAISV
jgi:hypothetical protein